MTTINNPKNKKNCDVVLHENKNEATRAPDANAAVAGTVSQLSRAIITGNVDDIKILSKLVEKSDLNDSVFLACMTKTCTESVIPTLFEVGADKEYRDSSGRTYVHEAASYGNVIALTSLAKAGADMNAKDKRGSTPLFEAAMFGHLNVAKALKNMNVDVSIKNIFRNTAEEIAKKRGYEDIAKLLRSK